MRNREGETPVPLFFGPVPPRLDAPTARRRDRHRLGQAPDREGWRARSGVPDHGAEVRKTEARARGQLMSADIYSAQVALLVRIIPEIAREDIFALKGGTAINLFVRSEEHTSELQSLMRISYAVFCLKKKTTHTKYTPAK